MTTQSDIDAIRRLLKNGQAIPTSMVRSLVEKTQQLLTICNQQSQKIQQLEAERKQKEREQ